MKEPLVSIVIPYYNRLQKIRRCLDAVLGQSYSNIEVIVIDDASQEILEPNGDSRVKVFRNAENLGPGPSRNVGFQHAKGEFVTFLDSDDYWELDFLESTVTALILNPAAVMVYANGWNVDEGGQVLGDRRDKIKKLHTILPEILSVNRHWGTSGCLWRKKDIQNIRWIASRTWEDYAFDIEVAIGNNTIIGLEEQLVYYDISGMDKLSKKSAEDLLEQKILSIQHISDALCDSKWRHHPRTKKLMRYILLMNFIRCSNQNDRQLLSESFKRWNGFFGRLLWHAVLLLPESRKMEVLELWTGFYRKQIR